MLCRFRYLGGGGLQLRFTVVCSVLIGQYWGRNCLYGFHMAHITSPYWIWASRITGGFVLIGKRRDVLGFPLDYFHANISGSVA